MTRELALPEVPRQILPNTLPALRRFIPVEQMSPGGGPAVAVLWRHRISVDIDLFVDPAVFMEYVCRRRGEFEDRVDRLDSVRSAMLDE